MHALSFRSVKRSGNGPVFLPYVRLSRPRLTNLDRPPGHSWSGRFPGAVNPTNTASSLRAAPKN